MRPIDAIRAGWRITARRASSYQFEIAISLVYYLLLGPAAIVGRLTGARTLDAGRARGWRKREPVATSVADLERQF